MVAWRDGLMMVGLVIVSLSHHAVSANRGCAKRVKVQVGDTCWSLGDEYGMNPDEFSAANPNVNCDSLQIGQKVCVSLKPDTSTCSTMREVKTGDNCSIIIETSGLTSSEFYSLNRATNCSNLRTGQQVCVGACTAVRNPASNGLLMDYIGASGNPISLGAVPVMRGINHYFILSFLIDANSTGQTQNGDFQIYWADSLSPEAVAKFKAAHHNVKVLASLGGWSQFIPTTQATRIVKWYDPPNPEEWIATVVKSLTTIIEKYHLDGIDIDYETFPTNKTFTYCIGEVIKTLKSKRVISLATMAPYNAVLSEYHQLYRSYGTYIDYVNYQFYAADWKTVGTYVQDYNNQAKFFPREKLLASTEVGGRGLQGADFFEAVDIIRSEHGLPGVFLWSADESKQDGFLIEKVAQCTLKANKVVDDRNCLKNS